MRMIVLYGPGAGRPLAAAARRPVPCHANYITLICVHLFTSADEGLVQGADK